MFMSMSMDTDMNMDSLNALQLRSITQSHWSSELTVCFPSRGSAVRVPGMHEITMYRASPVVMFRCNRHKDTNVNRTSDMYE